MHYSLKTENLKKTRSNIFLLMIVLFLIREYLDDFMELLSHRFGTKRVLANTVYQEYIANRHHVHMNSTQWPTLTDFVKWLGRNGKILPNVLKFWFTFILIHVCV